MVDTTPVKTAMPNWYLKCGSFKKIKEQFGAFFGLDKAPEKPIIQRWVKKFGTVGNLNSKSVNRTSHSGRPKSRTQDVIDIVRESVEQSPKRSLRKRCKYLDLSFETCGRVIVEGSKKYPNYPYRIQTNKLTVADKTKRKAMADKMLEKMNWF